MSSDSCLIDKKVFYIITMRVSAHVHRIFFYSNFSRFTKTRNTNSFSDDVTEAKPWRCWYLIWYQHLEYTLKLTTDIKINIIEGFI